ncbi:MAG: exodeoxyribonuclease V subunit gamma [Desulfobulbaceae bacterium]|nr:exodeoxyribonuclease V subunit gamma [Desulfobulbaceae bacterium]
MAFYLYSSNRLEALVAALVAVTGAEPLPPFAPETVVVQSGGMARWLSYQLAVAQGICANLDCPFPNDLMARLFRLVLPELAARPTVDRQILQWQLLRILPELVVRPEYTLLADYLGGGSELKKYQLAGRLADRFDQYLIFRPEMVLGWEAGTDDHWQALLWRELVTRPDCLKGLVHRAHLWRELLAVLAAPGFVDPGLPQRLSLFGLSSLPPYHLRIFAELARHTEVHFYLFNPSRKFWEDILPERAIGRLTGELSAAELHLDEGNPLLASWGLQGQELFRMLQECRVEREYDLFVDPVRADTVASRLAVLQADILELRGVAEGGGESLAVSDRSLQIHACASPRRELEVLHDQLLALFEELPDLEPRDILVMTPDIELYSALIPTVFGAGAEGGAGRIPYSIADRKVKNEGEVVGAFLALLELSDSRLELARVLAVLEQRPVRARFQLSPAELELVERWLLAVNIRWGIDEADRAALGLPATRENTWRFGLDRLLLGYAMDASTGGVFADILPYGGMESGTSEVLGKLLDFSEILLTRVRQLSAPRPLAAWSELLLGMAREMLEPLGEQDLEWRFLLETLAALAKVEVAADFRAAVTFPVVAAHLEGLCQGESMSGGFLAGRVTFCELLPMRAVPFRVVCLLGMNDGDYPRSAPVPSFDLIGAAPRPGDRSRRKDDRYLFLEALLSAREVFYLSYLGQSVRDGSRLSPSVLVSELVEYLEQRFPGQPVKKIVHPLQPFSPDYFGGRPELFSFSAANQRAALALAGAKSAAVLVPGPLAAPPDSWRQVSLEELADFFRHPARFFCRRRLGIHLEREAGELPDSENFTLAGLERFHLGGEILEALVDQSGAGRNFLDQARRNGVLPHGSVGQAAFAKLLAEVEAVATRLPPLHAGRETIRREGELALAGFTLRGQVELLPEIGQFRYRFAAVKAGDLSDAWLRHLFLQALAPGGSSLGTVLVGSDKAFSFGPVAEAQGCLAGLLAYYWQGLQQPLPFFPESSREYQERIRRGESPALAQARALRKWEGSEYGKGEGEEPYHQLCYRGLNPLTGAFAEVAKAFWAPLLENCHG